MVVKLFFFFLVQFIGLLFTDFLFLFLYFWSVENYPSEMMRAELSEKLGLSDRQLQMWFCHRRLKDKKDLPLKKPRKAAALTDSPVEEPKLASEVGAEYGSGSGSGSSPFTRSELRNVVPRGGYYESPQTIMELRAIACVEAQLGEPLREDGPILGVEFDPLPPDAFGAPLGMVFGSLTRWMFVYLG